MSNEEIKLTIHGEPVPQERPAFDSRSRHAYDRSKSRNWKADDGWQARTQYREKPITDPIYVEMDFYRFIQVGGSKKTKADKKAGKIMPTSKPDVDNLYKSTSDALTGIIWKDDNQIISIKATKHYDDGNGSRVEIKVKKYENAQNK